jgi:hypothetical protein
MTWASPFSAQNKGARHLIPFQHFGSFSGFRVPNPIQQSSIKSMVCLFLCLLAAPLFAQPASTSMMKKIDLGWIKK